MFALSKTMWFSALVVSVGIATEMLPIMQNAMSPDAYGKVLMIVGLMSAVLRAVTNQSLSDKTST